MRQTNIVSVNMNKHNHYFIQLQAAKSHLYQVLRHPDGSPIITKETKS
jgi:hypothetical protein